MSENSNSNHNNIYQNVIVGAMPTPLAPHPDQFDEAFAQQANELLSTAAEVVRDLIGAHQSAIAIIVQKDWVSARKFFSLSSKYAAFAKYQPPAKGFGLHDWILHHNAPVRLTQAEMEAHPEFKAFGFEAGKHPPMRGWLAAPLTDRQGVNWGLIQVSDKYEGDFTAEDERKFVQFARLVSMHLQTLWDLRTLQKAASA